METVINAVIIILLGSVVIVLLTGLVSMAVGGRFTPKFRNKIMRARVIIQSLILFVVVITFVFSLLG